MAEFLQIALYVVIFCLAFLAIFFLRGRRLSWAGYISWGLIAVLVPVLGPFLVILSAPGEIK